MNTRKQTLALDIGELLKNYERNMEPSYPWDPTERVAMAVLAVAERLEKLIEVVEEAACER